MSPTDNPNLRDIGSLVHKFRNKQLRMIKREKKQNKEKKEKGKLLSSLPVAGGATVSLPAMITLMQLIPQNPGDYYYYQVLSLCTLNISLSCTKIDTIIIGIIVI